MTSTSDGGESTTTLVPNHLAALVPSFDPAKDDLVAYTQKVQLLVGMWPDQRWTELATRLILNCSGSAFLKLQLQQGELTKNEKKSIQRIIEVLGGHWGQINLEKQYEYAERALYRCSQKNDETADSFLARADIMWTELISRNVSLKDLQPYVTLRGSLLSSEDKKRVLLDADTAGNGKLSSEKVSSAIRLLGATFFQDMTGSKKVKGKTYDQAALVAEGSELDDGQPVLAMDTTEDYLSRRVTWLKLSSRRVMKTQSLSRILKEQPLTGCKTMKNLLPPWMHTLMHVVVWEKKLDIVDSGQFKVSHFPKDVENHIHPKLWKENFKERVPAKPSNRESSNLVAESVIVLVTGKLSAHRIQWDRVLVTLVPVDLRARQCRLPMFKLPRIRMSSISCLWNSSTFPIRKDPWMSPVLNSFLAVPVLLVIHLGNWGKPFNLEIMGPGICQCKVPFSCQGLRPPSSVILTNHLSLLRCLCLRPVLPHTVVLGLWILEPLRQWLEVT